MSGTTASSSAQGSEDQSDVREQAPSLAPPTAAHFSLAVALVALGEFALFDVTPGAAAGLFSAALVLSMAALNPKLLTRRSGMIIFILLLIGCAAIVEEPSFLALGVGVAGLAAFTVGNHEKITANAVSWLHGSLAFLPQILIRLPIDLAAMPRWAKGQRWSKGLAYASWVWFVPLTMSLVFLALFASANPILSKWLGQLSAVDTGLPQATQVFFWVMLAFFVWAFLRSAATSNGDNSTLGNQKDFDDAELVTKAIRKGLLSPAAVCRSLLLFNAVFALQNALDYRFLWLGEALPVGVTYADYAHAGTYPLAASALLAAVFVLLAFPSRLRTRGSRVAAALVYLWMAQTVFLVASAIQRMGLYIDAYALTHLRVVGLAVMGLIAAGLVLIALRIAFGKGNGWLVNANAAVLLGTLYTACFVDIDRIIADYNVANCREMGGNGVPLDVKYLQSLGPSAIPALKSFETDPETLGSSKAWFVVKSRAKLAAELRRRQSDWRSWTYRGFRLGKLS